MVWISIGLRAVVNVEALNMVESIGNVARHRKAAIVYRSGSSYVLRYAPVVSGESLAHAYQSWLARIAKARGLPVCYYCSLEEFVKHAQPEVFGSQDWEKELKEAIRGKKAGGPEQIESSIVENCVVEDVGGFLVTAATPVKRTSRIYFSYMVPAIDAIEKSAVEPQMHVRHAPQASQAFERAQMPYYVEVASAVYVASALLDVAGIGYLNYSQKYIDGDKRVRRVEVAIDAISHMLETRIFGAKLSRFSPVMDYESMLVVVSRNIPFTVSPPARKDYIGLTMSRVNALRKNYGYEFRAFTFTEHSDVRGELEKIKDVTIAPTITDLFSEVKKVVAEWMGRK